MNLFKKKKITLELTHGEMKSLIRLVHLGSWMLNANRVDNKTTKTDRVEQTLYRAADEAHLSEVEYEEELKRYIINSAFEGWLHTTVIENYDSNVFMDNLAHSFAEKKMQQKYGKALKKMDRYDRAIEELRYVDTYEEFLSRKFGYFLESVLGIIDKEAIPE